MDWKDVERNGRGLISGIIMAFAWRDRKSHEDLQPSRLVSGPRFE
jgi:hypothetical protein